MSRLLSRFSPMFHASLRYWDVLVVVVAAAAGLAYWVSQRPERQFALAMADVQQKNWDAVRRRAALLEKSVGYFPHAQLLWGISEIQNKKFLYAIEDLEAATEDERTSALAFAYAGEAWYKLKQYGRAEQMLLAAEKEEPNRADTHRWLSSLYYDTGAMVNALEHLEKTAELAPEDARPHRLIGLINKDFENYEAAAAAYRESLRRNLHPMDRETVLLEFAESLIRARQYSEALPILEQARRSSRRQVLEAECHLALGEIQKARKLLDGILRREPARHDALLLLSGILLEQNELAEAINALNQCVKLDPLDYTARYRLSQAYQRQGDQTLADKHGRIAEQSKRLREKFWELHHAAISKPHDAEVRYQLGVTAEELNRPDLARTWYESALALDPGHAKAAEALAR